MPKSDLPLGMPVLSAGRHRTPQRGACFMEFASYLAGERWSDHPQCTHPVLAALARMVNDCSSDRARAELVSLIPSVIGLAHDDPRDDLNTGVVIAVRAASVALPVASFERQRSLATGLLCCERYLELQGELAPELSASIQHALDQVPDAAHWARIFATRQGAPRTKAIPRICDAILRISVIGIAAACIDDADQLMHDLLENAIDDCAARIHSVVVTMPSDEAMLQPAS